MHWRKREKIAPYRGEVHGVGRLVLPDHIEYGIDPEDHQIYRAEVVPNLSHNFAKIILLDPRTITVCFEILSVKPIDVIVMGIGI